MKALSPWFSTVRLVEDIRKVLVERCTDSKPSTTTRSATETRSTRA